MQWMQSPFIDDGCKSERGTVSGIGASPLPEKPAAVGRRYLGAWSPQVTSGRQARISREDGGLRAHAFVADVLGRGLYLRASQRIPELPRACHRCVPIHKSADSCSQTSRGQPPHPGQPTFFRPFPVNSACQNPTIHRMAQVEPFSPVRLVQTGESAYNIQGVPTSSSLAVLKALCPCELWANWGLECFDPGRLVIVEQRFHN